MPEQGAVDARGRIKVVSTWACGGCGNVNLAEEGLCTRCSAPMVEVVAAPDVVDVEVVQRYRCPGCAEVVTVGHDREGHQCRCGRTVRLRRVVTVAP